jgi:CBS domain-containing protein
VVGRRGGRPLGWVTARGLLAWIGGDDELVAAREAITERPVSVTPSAPLREALALLSQPGATHVLVAHADGAQPEGVISDVDFVERAIV